MRRNLIPNPRGALDVQGWAVANPAMSRLERVTDWAAEGLPVPVVDGVPVTTGFKITRLASGSLYAGITPRLSVGAGRPVTYSLYHYRPANGGQTFLSGLSLFDYATTGAGPSLASASCGTVTGPGWDRYAVTLPVVHGGWLFAEMYMVNDAAIPVQYYTAILLEQTNRLLPYFDGDSRDALWDGIPHQSASALLPSCIHPIADQVQDAVAAAIDARTSLRGVTCGVGYPVGGVAERSVWVPAAFAAKVPRRMTGRSGSRDEEAEISVRLVVTQTTDVPTDPRDAALLLENDVEDAIGEDPTLGGLVSEARVTAISGEEAVPEERKRQYGVTVTVAYTATVPA